MEKQEVYCEACNREIKSKQELVVTTSFFSLVCYHNACFSKSIKGFKSLFVSNSPINGIAGTTYAIFLFLVAILFFIFSPIYNILAILLLVVPLYRVLGWFMYERHLEP
ncbi:hypothetical protein IM538_14375 [Cytobacillus suaedae]|nr:hypothetical protein IM538_14375 [Cytobacillus suaedae]